MLQIFGFIKMSPNAPKMYAIPFAQTCVSGAMLCIFVGNESVGVQEDNIVT